MIMRYTFPEIAQLWSDENKYSAWLKVELAVCEAQAKRGLIPRKSLNNILKKAAFDVEEINEIESKVHHDVIAFLTSVNNRVGADSRYIHLGMTSSDILDISLSFILKQVNKLLISELKKLMTSVKKIALKYKDTPILGRTHGIAAEPTTAGLKFALWYAELERNLERLKFAASGVEVGKISGAVGTYAHIDPSIEKYVCRKLGLQVSKISSQIIQRDRHAFYIATLSVIASSIEKFATVIRSLQRTEIGEMEEPFAPGQKGSSAMPHKKNPIICERMCGLARLIRGYAVAALENVALWDERDISHSSNERMIIPSSTSLIYYMIIKFNQVITGLNIREDKMLNNIFSSGGLVASQKLLLLLTDASLTREEAYDIVQRLAMLSYNTGRAFFDIILEDAELKKYLSDEQLESVFDISYYLRNTDKIFERVFGK
ncbi:MAG: adenylosuccinate lyase [candidate division Zixibacteria bacterium]|nr:adenylosuccinate lyase [candidate division Zixibacteria bacterium]